MKLPDFPSEPVAVQLPRGLVVYVDAFAEGVAAMRDRCLLEAWRADPDPDRAERAWIALLRACVRRAVYEGEDVQLDDEALVRIARWPGVVAAVSDAIERARAAWAAEGNGSGAASPSSGGVSTTTAAGAG